MPCVPVGPWVQDGTGHSVTVDTQRALLEGGAVDTDSGNTTWPKVWTQGIGQGPQWDQIGIEKE